MGSAASLEALPAELDEDQVKLICGPSFSENDFRFLARGGDTITKDDFLTALQNKTDVFLTHDWGMELGQDNHARVAEINKKLQARGLTTWFDSEQMQGNVKKQMALGIDNAQCIITFVTKRYIEKVGGFNAEDNCQLEFNYAARRKTAARMIPVVMEERVRNTGSWDGEVGLVLGGRLYVDMCGDVFDQEYCDTCVDDIYSKIIKIIKTPVNGFNPGGGNMKTAGIIATAESLPTQVQTSPKKQKKKDTKPLKELSVDEVGTLLESNNLGKFVDEMRENDVDGPTLMETNSDEELRELGISLAVKARMFFKKVEEYKFHGVPFSLLGIEATQGVDKEATKSTVKYGDGTFTIAGVTGQSATRANGTYEISEEMQNGLPVYSKVGDDDTCIELVHGASGWRWYLKQESDKGPSISVCFAYCQCQDEDMKLPSETNSSSWFFNSDSGFVSQDNVSVTPSSSLALPVNISQLLSQARSTIKAAKEDQLAEERRSPISGSFSISGTTSARVNGTFEPTEESQNGFPVYVKKGDKDTWVEMVYKPATGWRWYLKPLENRGPDSSVCFAYAQCSENEGGISLPQDCSTWHISGDDGFSPQDGCEVSLAVDEPVPEEVLCRLRAGIEVVRQRKETRLAEENRGVIAGTFSLHGATGKSEGRFNGRFEPSDEVQNGFPVYRKNGDPDTWLELVFGMSGWRWYLKPANEKGPDSSVCFAYFQCDEKDVRLPSECTTAWSVHTVSGFVSQAVIVTVESTLPLPDSLARVIDEGKAAIKKKYEDKIAENTRGAAAGAFNLSGATGKSASSVNGSYEPSEESQHGFPVYVKKGEKDIWVEMVYTEVSGWRWYLKPTANKGPDSSICFAYAQCSAENMLLPREMPTWYVSTSEGFVVQHSVHVEAVGGPNPPGVEKMYQDGLRVVAKWVADKAAEENRNAVDGAFRLSGASGKSADRVNGVFEPTDEAQNGMPVYSKKGDPGLWLELVHGTAGWRWYLKPTANRGPDSAICFAYYTHDGHNVKLPVRCTDRSWYCNTDEGFVAQDSIKVSAVGEDTQSDRVMRLVEAKGWLTGG